MLAIALFPGLYISIGLYGPRQLQDKYSLLFHCQQLVSSYGPVRIVNLCSPDLEPLCLQASLGYANRGRAAPFFLRVFFCIGKHEQLAVPFSQVGTIQDRNDGG